MNIYVPNQSFSKNCLEASMKIHKKKIHKIFDRFFDKILGDFLLLCYEEVHDMINLVVYKL